MQESRGIEEAIEEMVVERYRYREGVEEQSIKCKNRSSIYPPAIEKLLKRQELSRSIRQVSRSYRECDKKKLKKLDRQQGIKKVLRNNPSNARTEARSIHQLSRSYWRDQSFLDLSARYREAIGNAIRKSWRSSTDNKVSRRCWASF